MSRAASREFVCGSMRLVSLVMVRLTRIECEKALFHSLYGRGTHGTIPRLPLGPGEGCVEIVQA